MLQWIMNTWWSWPIIYIGMSFMAGAGFTIFDSLASGPVGRFTESDSPGIFFFGIFWPVTLPISIVGLTAMGVYFLLAVFPLLLVKSIFPQVITPPPTSLHTIETKESIPPFIAQIINDETSSNEKKNQRKKVEKPSSIAQKKIKEGVF